MNMVENNEETHLKSVTYFYIDTHECTYTHMHEHLHIQLCQCTCEHAFSHAHTLCSQGKSMKELRNARTCFKKYTE